MYILKVSSNDVDSYSKYIIINICNIFPIANKANLLLLFKRAQFMKIEDKNVCLFKPKILL